MPATLSPTGHLLGPTPTLVVAGLEQIQRSLAKSGPEVDKAMRIGLRTAADPVAKTAHYLELGAIRNMKFSQQWSVNRVGVTRSSVYVAPKQKGVKTRHWDDPRRRPNLVGLVMERAYKPALQLEAPFVERAVYQLLGRVSVIS